MSEQDSILAASAPSTPFAAEAFRPDLTHNLPPDLPPWANGLTPSEQLGRVTRGVDRLRDAAADFREEVDDFREEVDEAFGLVRADHRALSQEFKELQHRVDAAEAYLAAPPTPLGWKGALVALGVTAAATYLADRWFDHKAEAREFARSAGAELASNPAFVEGVVTHPRFVEGACEALLPELRRRLLADLRFLDEVAERAAVRSGLSADIWRLQRILDRLRGLESGHARHEEVMARLRPLLAQARWHQERGSDIPVPWWGEVLEALADLHV